jgi:hypothetical protein
MTQHNRILMLLRERGPAGVANFEFPQHFILNYKARLDELREKGHDIRTVFVSGNVWKYVLQGAPAQKESWQAVRRRERIEEMETAGQGRLV